LADDPPGPGRLQGALCVIIHRAYNCAMDFARRIINWQRRHGRHGLPWQGTRDAYRIWLSEIMLQQTQVATVIDYYARFLQRFPDLATLARARQDEVMPYWAGLGYYARARNLHRCAQVLIEQWGGRFPERAEDIETLPGIGRSTAAAIAAFSTHARAAILDGNVKRVFARHFGIEGEPSRRAVEQQMWTLAQARLPGTGKYEATMPVYTQGLMDLGATVCTRTKPDCDACPLRQTCIARRDGRQHTLPTPKTRKIAPERSTGMLILASDDSVLLQRRPQPGIWGGLWSLPEFDPKQHPLSASLALGIPAQTSTALAPFVHAFTHYRLHISPHWVHVGTGILAESRPDHAWIACDELADVALPAPVRKLLDGLYQKRHGAKDTTGQRKITRSTR